MNNETNEQKTLSENVKISFDNIVKVYEESSLLLKDLVAELEKKEFEKIQGNEIAAYVSKHIDKPQWWFPSYASFSFKRKDEPDSKRLLSATVLYFDFDPKVLKPYLIMGVCEMFDGGSWGYWWMYEAFFNSENMFRYYENNKIQNIGSPHLAWKNELDEWGFKMLKDRETYWPKAGKLFAVPLLEIKSEDVGKLAERVSKLWDTNLEWDMADQ